MGSERAEGEWRGDSINRAAQLPPPGVLSYVSSKHLTPLPPTASLTAAERSSACKRSRASSLSKGTTG